MAEKEVKDSLENAGKKIQKLDDNAVKVDIDTAADEMKKIGNAAIEAGNDAIKEFDTAAENMRKPGNDIIEAFDTADIEMEKSGIDTKEAFDKSDEESNLDLSANSKVSIKDTEKDIIIKTLRKMADFLQSKQVKNVESLQLPLAKMTSSFKFLPIDQSISFSELPCELKSAIFSRLDYQSSLLAASVSGEWSELLKRNLDRITKIELKVVSEAEEAIDRYETGKCIITINNSSYHYSHYSHGMAQDLLRGLSAVKLNTGLKLKVYGKITVHHNNIMKLLGQCLKNVSKLSLLINEYITINSEMLILFDAIDKQNITLDLLEIWTIDWRTIMSDMELKSFLDNPNIKNIEIRGRFNPEQLEAANSLPHTNAMGITSYYQWLGSPFAFKDTFMIRKRST